jgi:hypothetical protein
MGYYNMNGDLTNQNIVEVDIVIADGIMRFN